MEHTFSYDRLPSPSKFFVQTFPDRLATNATLFGMEPAHPATCRVLELGCGNGSNLIAQAYLMPEASFVGVDLAKVHIDDAKAAAVELGLKNVEFRQMDVMEMSRADFGTFDYITAHGLFSWVPEPVRGRVLELFRELLNDQGVGYISYSAFPGAYHRQMSQSILRLHTRRMQDPNERVKSALSFLSLLAENTSDGGVYRAILKQETERHSRHHAADVFHDDLSEINQAYYFSEFSALLENNGLQFLSEAELHAMGTQGLSQEARRFLADLEDHIEREQYLDLFRGRIFRQTLFCRSEISLRRPPEPELLDRFLVSSSLSPRNGKADLSPKKVETFLSSSNVSMQVDQPLAKAALLHLGSRWARAVPFPELARTSMEMLEQEQIEIDDPEKQVEILRKITLQLVTNSNLVELRLFQPDGPTELNPKPKVNRLARWQMKNAEHITTLLGLDMKIDDKVSHRLSELMDGTRTRNALLDEIGKFIRSAHGLDGKRELLRTLPEWLDDSLNELARLGVFEA